MIKASRILFNPKKNRGAIFFGVDRWGAFSKKRTPKAEKNNWLRELIKKHTPKVEKNELMKLDSVLAPKMKPHPAETPLRKLQDLVIGGLFPG